MTSEVEYNSRVEAIEHAIWLKFRKEKIDTDSEIYQQVILDCAHAISDIVRVIAIGGDKNIQYYVLTI